MNGSQAKESRLKHAYKTFVQGENAIRHFVLLIIRLYWGAMLIMTGFGKLANIHMVSDYFAELHIPLPMVSAYLTAIFELLGGLSLFLGLFARLFTIPLIIIFLSAYSTAHSEALTGFFRNPSLFIMQDPFLYLYASLIVLCFGSGAASIDYWIEKKAYGKAL